MKKIVIKNFLITSLIASIIFLVISLLINNYGLFSGLAIGLIPSLVSSLFLISLFKPKNNNINKFKVYLIIWLALPVLYILFLILIIFFIKVEQIFLILIYAGFLISIIITPVTILFSLYKN